MCSHKGKIQSISDGILILLPESCPKEGTLGAGVPRGGGQKIFFSNMVMRHIKSKGMTSRIEC